MSPRSMAGSSQGRSVPSQDTNSNRCAGAKRGGSTAPLAGVETGVAIQTTHNDATTKPAKPKDVNGARQGGRL